eukprot:CAMPEP_0198682012 /NCGR_PEP_ID=MMETSP1468-20131203/7908_1 /TAXON_ID=1461545 /ORGANISM="Mantoniella sp, Strain CCMP1436" /LENGTH=40 /DNA_ID= /DNA_START= /DNA_END= /DNA_ORIENTATION=
MPRRSRSLNGDRPGPPDPLASLLPPPIITFETPADAAAAA